MAPNGFKTKFGPRPQLSKLGVIEHPTSDSYVPRTNWNVKNADATMRFAFNFKSPGEWCTFKAIRKYKKPYFDIDLNEPDNYLIFDIFDFFDNHNVEVLNIAGNCGKNKKEAKVIYDLTRKLLTSYITKYHEHYPDKEVWSMNDIKESL